MLRGMMAFAIAASVAAPASATTLVRSDVDKLVADNGTIVVGEVLDATSYWNADGTFILTDVRVSVADVLKGRPDSNEFTVTLMGGQVGDLTTLIIGGAQLIPGRSYVMFLNKENLPGVQDVTTVRDHCQGVFDLVMTKSGLRAISQANGQPLVPDNQGYIDAPGGVEGMPYKALVDSVRDLVARPLGARGEMEAN
ncbi:MAG TPA: hypothetical protein VLE27_08290 [Thermoanaerobaculia bacterium]|nr:hypothetical protein [Thermoanaerobaculia bacterium]